MRQNSNNELFPFEATFPEDFRKDEVSQVLNFVTTGKFCQLISIPGGGKATILKLLAGNQNLRKFHLGEKEASFQFTYLNLLELPSFEQPTIDKFLLLTIDPQIEPSDDHLTLIKQLSTALTKFVIENRTLVLLFDHFDEIQYKIGRSFFQTLKNCKFQAKYQLAAVFGTKRDLAELVDPEISAEFYDFFVGNTIYMKLYDEKAATFMFAKLEEIFNKKLQDDQKESIIEITGGHPKLTRLTAELVHQENVKLENRTIMDKPLIKAHLVELWSFLTAQEQKVLLDILQSKPLNKNHTLQNLQNFDLVRPNLTLTIPLLESFVRLQIPSHQQEKIIFIQSSREILKGENVISDLLSPQEYRLLKFLIANPNRVVERDEIIKAVWPDAQLISGISDEAIDQLVYRLRKKIEDEPANPKHVTTVKGRGFRFVP